MERRDDGSMWMPVYVLPYEDELWFSWLLRLADLNDMDVKELRKLYFAMADYQSDKSIVPAWLNGACFIYDDCEETMDPFPDPEWLLKRATWEYMYSGFRREGEQAAAMQTVLCDHGGRYDVKKPARFGVWAYCCRECLKEDLAAGRIPYLRTWHQPSIVGVCARHGNRLIGVRFTHYGKTHSAEIVSAVAEGKEDAYREKIMDKPMQSQSGTADELIAAFVKELYEDAAGFSFSACMEAMDRKLEALGFSGVGEAVDSFREDCGFLGDLGLGVDRLSSKVYDANPERRILAAVAVFKKYSEFKASMPKQEDILIKAECHTCGMRYVIPSYLSDFGYGCPRCMDKTAPEEFYGRILADRGYSAEKVPSDLRTVFKVKHASCGKEADCTMAKFIFGEWKCACHMMLWNQPQFMEAVEKDPRLKGFKFGREHAGDEDHYDVTHEACGRTFRVDGRIFLKDPVCPLCVRKARKIIRNCESSENPFAQPFGEGGTGKRRVRNHDQGRYGRGILVGRFFFKN